MARRLDQRPRRSAPRTRRAAARPQSRSQPSSPLDAWELIARVPAGTLAEVYRARPAVGASAAVGAYCVKRLKPEHESDPHAVALVRREARVGRTVSSPHLVPVLAAHISSAPHFVVMPWLDGATLAAHLCDGQPHAVQTRQRENTIPIASAVWIVRQVAEALVALNAAGWTHSDVKPANIMISPVGHATLLDLAFARRPDDEDRSRETLVAGTPQYLAPESLLLIARPDIRSDIYSLGAVLYEMLTGRLPFAAADAAALITAHRHSEPAHVRSLVPTVSKQLADLVGAMLAKDPLRRPQSPAEVVARLTAIEIAMLGE